MPRTGRPPSLRTRKGSRFGRLTVVNAEIVHVPPRGDRAVLCRCDCGTELLVRTYSLAGGNSRSCGCLARDTATKNLAAALGWSRSAANVERLRKFNRSEANRANRRAVAARMGWRTHGLTQHPLYLVWSNMRTERVRGIAVCQRWQDLRAFIADVEADIGPRPTDRSPTGYALYSLCRKDPDGDFEPGNVYWATASERRYNQRAQLGSHHELASSAAADDRMWCPACGAPFTSLSAFDRHCRDAHKR